MANQSHGLHSQRRMALVREADRKLALADAAAYRSAASNNILNERKRNKEKWLAQRNVVAGELLRVHRAALSSAGQSHKLADASYQQNRSTAKSEATVCSTLDTAGFRFGELTSTLFTPSDKQRRSFVEGVGRSRMRVALQTAHKQRKQSRRLVEESRRRLATYRQYSAESRRDARSVVKGRPTIVEGETANNGTSKSTDGDDAHKHRSNEEPTIYCHVEEISGRANALATKFLAERQRESDQTRKHILRQKRISKIRGKQALARAVAERNFKPMEEILSEERAFRRIIHKQPILRGSVSSFSQISEKHLEAEAAHILFSGDESVRYEYKNAEYSESENVSFPRTVDLSPTRNDQLASNESIIRPLQAVGEAVRLPRARLYSESLRKPSDLSDPPHRRAHGSPAIKGKGTPVRPRAVSRIEVSDHLPANDKENSSRRLHQSNVNASAQALVLVRSVDAETCPSSSMRSEMCVSSPDVPTRHGQNRDATKFVTRNRGNNLGPIDGQLAVEHFGTEICHAAAKTCDTNDHRRPTPIRVPEEVDSTPQSLVEMTVGPVEVPELSKVSINSQQAVFRRTLRALRAGRKSVENSVPKPKSLSFPAERELRHEKLTEDKSTRAHSPRTDASDQDASDDRLNSMRDQLTHGHGLAQGMFERAEANYEEMSTGSPNVRPNSPKVKSSLASHACVTPVVTLDEEILSSKRSHSQPPEGLQDCCIDDENTSGQSEGQGMLHDAQKVLKSSSSDSLEMVKGISEAPVTDCGALSWMPERDCVDKGIAATQENVYRFPSMPQLKHEYGLARSPGLLRRIPPMPVHPSLIFSGQPNISTLAPAPIDQLRQYQPLLNSEILPERQRRQGSPGVQSLNSTGVQAAPLSADARSVVRSFQAGTSPAMSMTSSQSMDSSMHRSWASCIPTESSTGRVSSAERSSADGEQLYGEGRTLSECFRAAHPDFELLHGLKCGGNTEKVAR